MPEGDTLQVIGLAIGAMIGAISTTGLRAKFLWLLTALLALLAFAYAGVLPDFGVALGSINDFTTPLIAPLTIGVVALMLRERQFTTRSKSTPKETTPIAPPRPSFAANTANRSKWEPNVTFRVALAYFMDVTASWANRNRTESEAKDQLINALLHARVTAWGKEHPTDREFVQITQPFWLHAEVTLQTNYAFSRSRSVPAYDVHLSSEEMALIWPPKEKAS
jgi:hypothetical protein